MRRWLFYTLRLIIYFSFQFRYIKLNAMLLFVFVCAVNYANKEYGHEIKIQNIEKRCSIRSLESFKLYMYVLYSIERDHKWPVSTAPLGYKLVPSPSVAEKMET